MYLPTTVTLLSEQEQQSDDGYFRTSNEKLCTFHIVINGHFLEIRLWTSVDDTIDAKI